METWPVRASRTLTCSVKLYLRSITSASQGTREILCGRSRQGSISMPGEILILRRKSMISCTEISRTQTTKMPIKEKRKTSKRESWMDPTLKTTSLRQVFSSREARLMQKRCLLPKGRTRSPLLGSFRLLTTKSMRRINRMPKILQSEKESL